MGRQERNRFACRHRRQRRGILPRHQADHRPELRRLPHANTVYWKGQPIPNTHANQDRADLDYNGRPMPPPDAVAGTYRAPDGQLIKVTPLTDEDRRTIVRWIDLGCPIDFDFDPKRPEV